MYFRISVLTLVLSFALAACAKEEQAGDMPPKAGAQATPTAGAAKTPAPATKPAKPDVKQQAKQIFNVRCAVCHGATGKGDGPGAAALNPKPRDYSDAAWQASVTDEKLKKVIVEGGVAVGMSELMAPNPDLGQKPEVLDEIVKMIRSFASK